MYTIIALLPPDLVIALEPHRQKYNPLAGVIPPHIAILDPFRFPTDALPILYEHVTEVGETYPPIKVSLAGWDVYEREDYRIRLPIIAGQPELIGLHNDLLTGPLCCLANHEQAGYCPHIIVGRFSTQAELKKARKDLKGFEPLFTFRITHVELFHRDKPTQPWRKKKRFTLEATVLSPPRKKKRIKIEPCG
ncbi:MAG: 2'-5' RNA ligase family protein [Anaerolineae bacterium]|nr:2'-5' RNA ligase family protein [Anaerolineae bacterium]